MKRAHATLIALLVGAAALAGTVAALKTVRLGQAAASPQTTSAEIARRTRTLDRSEAALKQALVRKPPALPPLPKAAPAAQRVVYVRPKPIVVSARRAGGEEDEHEDGEHGEHEGEGFDD